MSQDELFAGQKRGERVLQVLSQQISFDVRHRRGLGQLRRVEVGSGEVGGERQRDVRERSERFPSASSRVSSKLSAAMAH